ncbi:MAG: hypothetical protein ACI85I_000936 [Arenicella sp.]
MISEIETNKKGLENVVEYYKMLRDSARANSGKKELNDMPSYFSGLRTWTVANSAFNTAVQTGIIQGNGI